MPFVFAAGGGGGGGPPSCKVVDWVCDSWSECTSDGFMTRTCELVKTCKNPYKVKPPEIGDCKYVSKLLSNLKCQNLNNMKARVKCRLTLTDNELSEELRISYLPEECNAVENAFEREKCVNLYGDSQECWVIEEGAERWKCLRKILNVGDLEGAKQICEKSSNKAKCGAELKYGVYGLIKSRFYNLEERAEEYLEEGRTNLDEVVDIVTSLEEKKQEFNKAKTTEERRRIILDTRSVWKEFEKKVKNE